MEIIGTIIKGNQVGRTIGFPTANIKPKTKTQYPHGVYACTIIIAEKTHHGALNIGPRPTLDQNQPTIEVHIFNFDQNIYDQEIQVTVNQKIRDNQKFSSLSELKNQISKDIEQIKKIYKLK